MGKTIYEYATKSWPIVNGCSPHMRCAKKCWAVKTVYRLAHSPNEKIRAAHELLVDVRPNGELGWTGVTLLNEAHLTDPLRWRKPQRIAVAFHGDLFRLPAEQIDMVFAAMALCCPPGCTHRLNQDRHAEHQFFVLTKAVVEMRKYFARFTWSPRRHKNTLPEQIMDACHALLYERPFDSRNLSWDLPGWPLRNVLLGVSCEDQAATDERIPVLLQAPAAKRWVSLEPLVGPVSLELGRGYLTGQAHDNAPYNGVFLDWVVVGGESGPDARPMHPDWVRVIRDQCAAAGVPFFLKQWGEYGDFRAWTDRCEALELRSYDWPVGARVNDRWRVGKKYAGRLLDGCEHLELPEVGCG